MPVVECALCSCADLRILAAPILRAIVLHPRAHQSGSVEQLLPAYDAVFECMPTGEYMPHLLKHVLGKQKSIRTAATFLERYELSNYVSPAKLPDSFLVIGIVCRVIIGGDDPSEAIAQNRSEHLGSPACGDAKIDYQRGDENPEIATISFALPPGLVDIEVDGFWKSLPHLLRNGAQFRAYPVDAVAYAPQAEVQTKESVQDFYYPSSADLMDRSISVLITASLPVS